MMPHTISPRRWWLPAEIWVAYWPQFPTCPHGTTHQYKTTLTDCLPFPSHHLVRTIHSREGVLLPIQHTSSAHCGRIAVHWTVQSRQHPGCCLWGVGSGCTDTTKPNLTESHRKRGGKKKSQRRGGKTAPEEEYFTGKETRGWLEDEAKDNGERSRRVQMGSLFWCSAFLSPVDNPSDSIHPSFTPFFFFLALHRFPHPSCNYCTMELFFPSFHLSHIVAHSGWFCGPRWIHLKVWPGLWDILRLSSRLHS